MNDNALHFSLLHTMLKSKQCRALDKRIIAQSTQANCFECTIEMINELLFLGSNTFSRKKCVDKLTTFINDLSCSDYYYYFQ